MLPPHKGGCGSQGCRRSCSEGCASELSARGCVREPVEEHGCPRGGGERVPRPPTAAPAEGVRVSPGRPVPVSTAVCVCVRACVCVLGGCGFVRHCLCLYQSRQLLLRVWVSSAGLWPCVMLSPVVSERLRAAYCCVYGCHYVSVSASVNLTIHHDLPARLGSAGAAGGDPQRSAGVLYLLLLSLPLLASLLGGWAGPKEAWVGGLLAS